MPSAVGIHPFRINVPEAAILDLQRRLALTRWPDELPDQGWSHGVPLGYLQDLVNYWRSQYDWRRQETRLNELAQFTTVIDGTRVHFLHLRSPEPDALPLLITHGWPGSIVEFLGVVGPLSDPRSHGGKPADAFHVVAPSLPGFGFSGPTREPGWDVARVARAWAELMRRLGYERYGAQGGDWGARISWELGRYDTERVVGVHVNMLATTEPPAGITLTTDELARIERSRRFASELSGYVLLQATRPQTIAYALNDSPVGQLAWIVEKFAEWSSCEEVPEEVIARDDLLTNVMLYWLTGTAASSARFYYECRRSGALGPPKPTSTPTGVAVFPAEIVQPIRRVAERESNIVHWSELDRGGHFAAMEQPGLLVGDIRAFFADLRTSTASGASQ